MTAKSIRSLLIYTLIGGFAIWSTLRFRADLVQMRVEDFLDSPGLVATSLSLSVVNYLLRAARWQIYMAKFGHVMRFSRALTTYVAGFAFTLSPGKAGEMVRAQYYLKEGVPVARVAAACLTERIIDVLVIAVLAGTLVATSLARPELYWAGTGLIVVGVAAIWAVPWMQISAGITSRHPSGSIVGRGFSWFANTMVDVKKLCDSRLLLAGLALGLCAWLAEGVGLKLLLQAINVQEVTTVAAIGIYSTAVLAGAVSFLPGGLGTTEAVMIALLAGSGLDIADATLITLACRLITLWFAVMLGWVAVFMLRKKK